MAVLMGFMTLLRFAAEDGNPNCYPPESRSFMDNRPTRQR
jgi:hypothetical protein